jgi:arsenate reductase-like glutaredoxin family protein
LARAARELWIKVGPEIRRFDADERSTTEAEILAGLVHEDGWMRVPVLVDGPLLVRGYTEALYAQALRRGAS